MLYDVIIIGAGVEGSATGYHLSKTNKKVLLLEQFDRGHTRGSSHGGSRITRKAYHQSYYVNMMEEAFKLWSDIETESGRQLYHKTGIIVFGPEKSASTARKKIQGYIQSLKDNSVSHKVMSPKEVNDSYNDQLKLPEDYLCVFEEDGGTLRASKAVTTLQDLFIQNGGELLDNHQVTGITTSNDIITVQTGRGTQFNTRKLVLTTGPWTNKILQYTGITLPLKTCKAEVFYWKTENPSHFSADVFPALIGISGDSHVYGMPVFEYPGLLKVCPHSYEEVDPDARDCNGVSIGFPITTQFIKEHFKGVHYTKPAIHEQCIWTQTPTEDPFLDCHPNYPNIIIGAGFSGHGFKLAPVVGKILSELALNATPSYDLSPFKIQQSYSISPIPSPIIPASSNDQVEASVNPPPPPPPPTAPPSQPDVYDVIVVGAGVEGSATAYTLASTGKRNILLLEQFDRGHTRGSSSGGSRVTRRAYHEGYYVKMMDEAFKLWSDIEQKSGKQLYHKAGIHVFGSRDSKGGLNEASVEYYIQSLKDNSVSHKVMSPKEVNDSYNDQLKLPEDYLCVFEEDGGTLRASKAVTTLQDLFIQNGGELLDNHQVTGITTSNDIITVQTGRGTQFNTRKLVLTTGPWTNKILQYTGITLPLKILKVEHFYWKTLKPERFSPENFPIFVCVLSDGLLYGLPALEYPGLIKVSFHNTTEGMEVDPDSRDELTPRPVASKIISEFLRAHSFRDLDTSEPAIVEPCMYTKTSSCDPYLDYHPNNPNIIIGAGFSGHGFKLAPVVGKILSELALNATPSYDLTPFKIKRD